MDGNSVAVLVSVILTLASLVLGAKYTQGKAKAKQLSDLLNSVIAAAEDDQVSDAEFNDIVAKAKALADRSEG